MIYFNEIPKYHRNGKKKTKDELYSDYINNAVIEDYEIEV